MKELYELNSEFSTYKQKLIEIRGCLDLDKLKEEISNLEKETLDPNFWNNRENATKVSAHLSELEDRIKTYEKLEKASNDIEETLVFLKEEPDADFQLSAESSIQEFKKDVNAFENELYLSGPYDHNNAIIDFHPGAGGTEAHDWASMLLRMYQRFADKHKFKVDVLDILEGEEAGIKSATILIKGKDAFGMLKSERGVHRLVRISPFDASGSRHTSFASVNVMPEFNNEIKIDIKDSDLTVETYRSQGAGGQNVNKTESAVRIIHKPSGIVVTCQVERSQIQNREIAMNLLKSRLFQKMEQERLENLRKINGVKKDIEWGSQIRSYVFCPYTLVKDHRTDYSETEVAAVMDGNLDGFIQAYLQKEFKDGNKGQD
ncbi:MAG TPA: peptide chain release factor 2 [Firmicutes bacterium]|nr:peptide chain release factor 2 [Bacillota bacterium]